MRINIHVLTGYEGNNTCIVPNVPTIVRGLLLSPMYQLLSEAFYCPQCTNYCPRQRRRQSLVQRGAEYQVY